MLIPNLGGGGGGQTTCIVKNVQMANMWEINVFIEHKVYPEIYVVIG